METLAVGTKDKQKVSGESELFTDGMLLWPLADVVRGSDIIYPGSQLLYLRLLKCLGPAVLFKQSPGFS